MSTPTFKLFNQRKEKAYMISDNQSICPKCGGQLKYYDHVQRLVRTKFGNKKWVAIRRLRSRSCFCVPGILVNTLSKALNKILTGIVEVGVFISDCRQATVDDLNKGIFCKLILCPNTSNEICHRMARAAAQAAEAELDINSPSKVGYRIGGFFGMGFVNSLIDYTDKSYDAGASVAKSAMIPTAILSLRRSNHVLYFIQNFDRR